MEEKKRISGPKWKKHVCFDQFWHLKKIKKIPVSHRWINTGNLLGLSLSRPDWIKSCVNHYPAMKNVVCQLSRLHQFSKSFKVVKSLWNCSLSVKQPGSGWDAELLGISFGSKLYAYGNIDVLCRLKVNEVQEEKSGKAELNICTIDADSDSVNAIPDLSNDKTIRHCRHWWKNYRVIMVIPYMLSNYHTVKYHSHHFRKYIFFSYNKANTCKYLVHSEIPIQRNSVTNSGLGDKQKTFLMNIVKPTEC